LGSLKLKANLLAILFIIIPVIAYQYWLEAKQFILTGQSQAQLMMAQSLASLMSAREDLITQVEPELSPFLVLPSSQSKKIDGDSVDWEDNIVFQEFAQDHLMGVVANYSPEDLSFRLASVETPAYMYLMIQVKDDVRVYRDRDYLRLDASDHIRMEFVNPSGELEHYILTAYESGVMSAYPADEQWKYSVEGLPDERVFAAIQPTTTGYQVELRFPKNYLDDSHRMSLTVVDVDQPDRMDRMMVGTYPKGESKELNRIVLRSPQIESLLSQIDNDYGKVWVVDALGRLRAESGQLKLSAGELSQTVFQGQSSIRDRILKEALQGQSGFENNTHLESETSLIWASAPIVNVRNEVIGAVVIEQDEQAILSTQKEKMNWVLWSLVAIVLVLYAVLFAFSRILVGRIAQFQSSLTQVIDAEGRLIQPQLVVDSQKDELGELTQTTHQLLMRLQGYTSYLERLPRVLRHELHNPLNVINTALFNLEETRPELSEDKYLASVHRGLERLDDIVRSFTQASSLDEALAQEHLEPFDWVALIQGYVRHRGDQRDDVNLRFYTDLQELQLLGNDFRIEQMLDKLVDNAMSFANSGTDIVITLSATEKVELVVSNTGPLLEDSVKDKLFDPMVSVRAQSSDELHLGVGLFIARKIVLAHQGSIEILNRRDEQGVMVVARFDLA
jgi:two-component system sensor histidine kinase ChvG